MPTYYISFIVMFIVLFLVLKKNKSIIVQKVIHKRKTEEKTEMIELAKRFIEKECLIYAFDGRQFEGIIKEVSDGAVLIEKNDSLEAINLEFIIRIREYPRDKKGKKKSVVLD